MNTDFDIGNLVYVILLLIILIAGAFGKKKKPVQKVKSVVDTEDTGNPLMVEDVLERKLRELLGDYSQPSPASPPAPVIEKELVAEEKLDVPVTIESPYISPEAYSGGTKLDEIKSPFDSNEDILDTIGKEEEISNWKYEEEPQITDEIKLSEGKEPVSSDYNPELEELIANFDPREGFVYTEIFNRKHF